MRSRRGFTLVEVLVALGLVAVIGGAVIILLIRTEVSGRTAEAAQGAAYLIRAMVDAMQRSAPPWLPEENATITLSQDQVRNLLQGGGVSYTNPRLYEATVSRAPAPDPGMDRYTIQVCVSPGGQRLCYTQEVNRARVERAHLQSPSREGELYSPPSGQTPTQLITEGTLRLRISNLPSGAQANITLENASNGYNQSLSLTNGTYTYSLTPGTYTVTPGRVTTSTGNYVASPTSATIAAGQTTDLEVAYRLESGFVF